MLAIRLEMASSTFKLLLAIEGASNWRLIVANPVADRGHVLLGDVHATIKASHGELAARGVCDETRFTFEVCV